MTAQTEVFLEPAAQQLADATAGPPFLSELGYPAARKLLDQIQSGPVLGELATGGAMSTSPGATALGSATPASAGRSECVAGRLPARALGEAQASASARREAVPLLHP